MLENEVFRMGELLVVAMAEVAPKRRWRMDNYLFARAAKKEAERGNFVAGKFRLMMNARGLYSPEFESILRSMMFAGLIYYEAPAFTHMVLTITPSSAGYIKTRIRATDQEMVEAKALVAAYGEEGLNQ